ncbi:MAG: cob(I)yrinic acid a,c-diamide adenosyltransferase, partial [DPANN group archaeon]|nr:cob(I)yrinic acid a,c-diamide adenosyltransferase [DPANN group archaeon]
LITGREITKDEPRAAAYGDVDELNSFVGQARAKNKNDEIENILNFVQDKLFQLCSDVAAPIEDKIKINIKRISDADVKAIENFTNELNEKLPEIKNFIVFGNSELAAMLNVCRAVSRRAERKIVRLAKTEDVNEAALRFANRLSSLLFVIARHVTKIENKKEILWKQN